MPDTYYILHFKQLNGFMKTFVLEYIVLRHNLLCVLIIFNTNIFKQVMYNRKDCTKHEISNIKFKNQHLLSLLFYT